MATVEVNNTDPRNACEYLLSDSTQFFTHIALWGATIRGDSQGNAALYLNADLNAVLSDPARYIAPLQAKGIKVLLWVEGNHTGAGLANMKPAQIDRFTDALVAYDAILDGYFINDEWAEYGTGGWPVSTPTAYANFIIALRGKTAKGIFMYDFGQAYALPAEVLDCIDCTCNCYINSYKAPISGIPMSRYCPFTCDLSAPLSNSLIKVYTIRARNADARGVFFEKLPATPVRLPSLNAVAQAFNLTCTHTGVNYPKE